jgi:hypothetical protein
MDEPSYTCLVLSNRASPNLALPCHTRLLTKAKPIFDRVRELQAQATANLQEDAAKLTKELNEVLQDARADKGYLHA